MYTLVEIEIADKLKIIKEKVPSTERIFGYAWIISWFLAIWFYHIQLFITGIFCLFLAYFIFSSNEEKRKAELPIQLKMDKNTRTLTVQKIYEDNLKWEDNEICAGTANLPLGIIKSGDVITECKGNVALRHVPTNTLFGGFDFE
jgi:hypothetical protein